MLLKANSSEQESGIVVFYFGKAIASPFEIKTNDDETREQGIRLP